MKLPTLAAQEAESLKAFGGAWHASLQIRLERRDGTTVLADNRHSGPLRIQKPLWPEGEQTIHLMLLHPPGGLAGGDTVDLSLNVDDGAQGLITTPGAGKFYRAESSSTWSAHVRLGKDAQLEWLPQETIIQDGVNAHSQLCFELDQDASLIGCEILVLGRKAMREQFSMGRFDQCLKIIRDGRLILEDRCLWLPEFMQSSVGMSGRHVSALFWISSSHAFGEEEIASLEVELEQFLAPLDASGVLGVSQVSPGLCLVRAVGSSVEAIRRTMHQAWARCRNKVVGRAPTWPRIWLT